MSDETVRTFKHLWEIFTTIGKIIAVCYLYYAIWNVPPQWDAVWIEHVLISILWAA